MIGLFKCRHKYFSFPMSPRGKQRTKAAALTGTYVVCLECGKEFPYDWQNMEIINEESLNSVAKSYWRRIMCWRRHS
jgi:hypothetical protein